MFLWPCIWRVLLYPANKRQRRDCSCLLFYPHVQYWYRHQKDHHCLFFLLSCTGTGTVPLPTPKRSFFFVISFSCTVRYRCRHQKNRPCLLFYPHVQNWYWYRHQKVHSCLLRYPMYSISTGTKKIVFVLSSCTVPVPTPKQSCLFVMLYRCTVLVPVPD